MSTNKLEFSASLDGSGFRRGLNDISSSLAGGLRGFVLQAAGISGIEQAVSRTVDMGKELVNTAKRLGTSVEAVQVLRQAAKDAGIEVEKIAGAFEKINIAREKALGGGADAAKYLSAFSQVGVSQNDLNTDSAATIFSNQLSTAVQNKSVEEIARSMSEILGRGFGELIPVLKTNLEEVSDKLKKFGGLISTDAAVKLNRLGSEFELLGDIIVTNLAPAILGVIDAIMNGISSFLGWLDKKQQTKDASDSNSGFFKKGYHVVGGIGAGLLALIDAVGDQLGVQDATEMLPKRVDQANAHFKALGWDGGLLDQAADAVNDSGGHLQDKFDAWRKNFNKGLDAEANKIKNPAISNFFGLDNEDVVAKKSKKIPSDSLISVGNFLGAGSGVINSVAEQHLQVARAQLAVQMDTKTAILQMVQFLAESEAGGLSGGGIEVPP